MMVRRKIKFDAATFKDNKFHSQSTQRPVISKNIIFSILYFIFGELDIHLTPTIHFLSISKSSLIRQQPILHKIWYCRNIIKSCWAHIKILILIYFVSKEICWFCFTKYNIKMLLFTGYGRVDSPWKVFYAWY